MGKFFLKKDNLKLGLFLGLLAPLIGIIIYYFWKIYPFTWTEFWHLLGNNKSLVTSLSMICLFVNVVVFTLYINTHRDQTAKGIFYTTVILAIASLLFKFLR